MIKLLLIPARLYLLESKHWRWRCVWNFPFGDRISRAQKASSLFPAVYFRDLLICGPKRGEGGKHSPGVYHHEPSRRSAWVGAARIMTGDRPLHNVYMIERVMSTAWLCGYKTTSRICSVALRLRFSVREGGEVKEPQMLRFPFTPKFHVHYKSVPSKVNVKTLQINPESDRSSVSCLWYHFPSKWYGWGSDNCHPDLASLHHSPKTH